MSITLHTTHGDLKIELYCEKAPIAAKNFIGLAAAGKYDNTSFHRLMSSFLIQGGDTTHTGRGGESIYGDAFQSEIHPTLSHNKRGIIAMASKPKQPGLHLSQFYIIFSPQLHLDGQGTIFGHIIDGEDDVLTLIEGIEVDEKYKPTQNIAITSVTIHANPFATQE